ncbi:MULTISPECIES: XisH family protein [Pseudanabaena]|uniref:XisH protein n=2 Tax=Pseudanabaena TaxID=1152 RepID=L8N4W3_9CYAN|nr:MULTISPECIES: XisH family protein [Pseudanabaena]ELS33735.1 XisH protein [Pseudanabaena biceps PCC 7429]MDG3494070.1 XisH family protein [Pseudanabaena catenata USMAC16]
MSAKDIFHETVKLALIRDGWTITRDPLTIRIDRIKLEIDLGAEKVFAAEKDGKKIAVEVKSFVNSSNISDFHNALGQFLNYRLALQMTEPERIIYLAVPIDVFNTFFQERFPQAAIVQYDLKIIAYEPNSKEIVIWQN